MCDDAAEVLLGKTVPVGCVSNCYISKHLSLAELVVFGAFRENEKGAFAGGETELVGEGTVLRGEQSV